MTNAANAGDNPVREADQAAGNSSTEDLGSSRGSPVSGAMKLWRVEIERTQHDVVVVEADSYDEAIVKGQTDIFQVRTRQTVIATATPKTPPGQKPIESVYD